MDNEEQQQEQDKQLFLQLLTMLQVGVYQQMGLIANPLSNKTEVKLDIAKNTIDLIEMLERKTGGNLDSDEERIITNLLYELRMRYVELLDQEKEKPEESVESKAPPEKDEDDAE